jgi:hypothetical protein
MDHSDPPPSFQDSFTALLVQSEEFRRKVNGAQRQRGKDQGCSAVECLDLVEDLNELVHHLFRDLVPNVGDAMEVDLRRHCQRRVQEVARTALEFVTTKTEDDPTDEDHYDAQQEQACQGGVARMAEVNLILCEDIEDEGIRDEKQKEIVDLYISYQRRVIRERAKPSIARLVHYRKRQQSSSPPSRNHSANRRQHDADDEDEVDDDDDDDGDSKSQHVSVVATILGQASALILPLMQWKAGLPPEHKALHGLCDGSLSILDEQAQTLTKTVATWFLEDRKVDGYWMGKSARDESCRDQLGELDGVVYELSFCCQVFDRYIQFVAPLGEFADVTLTRILHEMHPEWTWKYASMERYLTTQQLQSALNLANPVQIVVGAPIQVPSVVEDAQYLSTRALQRAASTRSTQAIGTVAHSIASDVWSTDTGGGVHEALLEQRGCYREDSAPQISSATTSAAANGSVDNVPKTNSSSFAQALLGALDDDLNNSPYKTGTGGPANNRSAKAVRSPNSSTGVGFLGSLSSTLASTAGMGDKFLQIRLDTWLCALNGVHSASAACASIVEFLDSLLADMESESWHGDEGNGTRHNGDHSHGQTTSMIHLAREDLFRYSHAYQALMKTQAVGVVNEFCGRLHDAPVYRGSTFVPVLRYYLERENYELRTAQELQLAEDDARLHKVLVQPMDDCKLLRQFEKCDVDVLRVLCEEIARTSADLFMDVILSPVLPKRFTDWGSLLLSKEVRTVRNHLQSLLQQAVSKAAATSQDEVAPVLSSCWERLSQAVMILQLEKPSDWAFYQATSVVSPQELRAIMRLRVDFSTDAIQAVAVAAAIQGQE